MKCKGDKVQRLKGKTSARYSTDNSYHYRENELESGTGKGLGAAVAEGPEAAPQLQTIRTEGGLGAKSRRPKSPNGQHVNQNTTV